MKLYTYFLKGTQINGQFTSRPIWFKFGITKHVLLIRLWRIQIALRYRK